MSRTIAVDEYITVMIGSQAFGIPISRAQDLFVPERMTRVPLAPSAVAGLLNLRGRILTVIDMRLRLGLKARLDGSEPPGVSGAGVSATWTGPAHRRLVLSVEHKSESYGLLIDEVGEVVKLPVASREPNPVNMDPVLAYVSSGVHRLESRILILLDVDRVLDFDCRLQEFVKDVA